MKPTNTAITLGVDDMERSLHFYRDGLGFPTEGIIGEEFAYGAVVFIDMQPDLRLALWPRTNPAIPGRFLNYYNKPGASTHRHQNPINP